MTVPCWIALAHGADSEESAPDAHGLHLDRPGQGVTLCTITPCHDTAHLACPACRLRGAEAELDRLRRELSEHNHGACPVCRATCEALVPGVLRYDHLERALASVVEEAGAVADHAMAIASMARRASRCSPDPVGPDPEVEDDEAHDAAQPDKGGRPEGGEGE